MKIKKMISIMISAVMVILTVTYFSGNIGVQLNANAQATLTEVQIVNELLSKVGSPYDIDYCLRFVDEFWESKGGIHTHGCCAHTIGNTVISSTSIENIPIGADVFFDCSYPNTICDNGCGNICGHIGIYIGDGYMVDAAGGAIRKVPISYFNQGNWSFRGWGIHPGISIQSSGEAIPIITPNYQFFDFWGVDDNITVNDTYKLWFKQVGLGDATNSDVNVFIDGKEDKNCLGTIYQDDYGFFSFSINTNLYSTGKHTIYAVFRNTSGVEKWVQRTLIFGKEEFFDFWGVDDNITVNDTYKLWFKQVGLGDATNSDVNVFIDGKEDKNCLGTIYQDDYGFFSYILDTALIRNGKHIVYAVFRNTSGKEIWREKNINIQNQNFFDFWGVDDNIIVSDTYKLWFKQVGLGDATNSDVNLFIDGKDNTNHIGTLKQDEYGYFSHELNTTKYPNGVHTIYAVFRNTSGKEIWKSISMVINNPVATTTQKPTTTTTTSTTTQKPTTTTTTSTTTQKPTTTTTTSTTTQKPTTTTTTSTTTQKSTTTTTTTNNDFKLDKKEISLKNGEQYTIPINLSEITFKSTNTNVAVVSPKGIVTAIGIGEAIINIIDKDYNVIQLKVSVKADGSYLLGDVNNDGNINAVDASSVLAYYAMISTNKDGDFDENQKAAADVDHDGKINAVDASNILSYYAYVSTTKEEVVPMEQFMKKTA